MATGWLCFCLKRLALGLCIKDVLVRRRQQLFGIALMAAALSGSSITAAQNPPQKDVQPPVEQTQSAATPPSSVQSQPAKTPPEPEQTQPAGNPAGGAPPAEAPPEATPPAPPPPATTPPV